MRNHIKHIIYLHGFRSSPQSLKAQQFKRFMHAIDKQAYAHVPELPTSPQHAIAQVEKLISSLNAPCHFIGSSLGGYYATYLAEQQIARGNDSSCVLINPAVQPIETLQDYIGEITNYHTGHSSHWTPAHLDELAALQSASLAEKCLVLLQTEDTTLDYRLAYEKYHNASLYKGIGGNHSFERFDSFLPIIFDFFQLT